MHGAGFMGAHWLQQQAKLINLGSCRVGVASLLAVTGVDAECLERTVIATDALLSNVIEHAPTASVLSVSINPNVVRLAVRDQIPLDPRSCWRKTDPAAGLTLVWQLSHRPYVEATDSGKSVVAEITRRSDGAAQQS